MFDVVNPALLWGAAAIASPILIHLLMRQRPKRTPWAAMRWLRAAIQAAQRRYKLTNLLLLLLRCLILACLAMALARPSLAGLGSGGSLVLIIDRSASMGALADHHGALRQMAEAITDHGLHHGDIRVITVDDGIEVRRTGGTAETLGLLKTMQASPLPGGIDRAADDEVADQVLAACRSDSDVVLISDFRQDDGGALVALLQEKVRSLRRWQLDLGEGNAQVVGIDGLSDLTPGMPGELLLEVQGNADEVELAIDDGQPLARSISISDGRARIDLPPMEAGEHRLRLTLKDRGLRYDNHLELPLRVRDSVPVVLVEHDRSTVGAALLADSHRLDTRQETPASLLDRPLPADGLVALREPLGVGGDRLARWVAEGGVLWAPLTVLRETPGLRQLVDGLAGTEDLPGGALASGQVDLDPNLSRTSVTVLPALDLPAAATVHLRAGDDPLVVELPLERGRLIIETVAAEAIDDLAPRPAWPLFVRRLARATTAAADRPTLVEAGTPAPADWEVRRHGREHRLVVGEPILLEPGLWSHSDDRQRQLVVLPNRAEGRLHGAPVDGVVDRVEDALPAEPGIDWGPWLLAAVLLILLAEGALAAWAGRTFGDATAQPAVPRMGGSHAA